MNAPRFEWDPDKAAANERKHGITFFEAVSAFYDEQGVEFYDDEHSDWEDRFLLLGMSARLRLLLVCYCHREDDTTIRLISARRATRHEARQYWSRRR